MEEKHFGPVWFIPGERSGRYPFCHSVYIEGPGILIDPGSDRKRLEQLRTNPGVRAIWLSHWHEDHIADMDLFEDLPFYVGEPDARPLSSSEAFLDAYGINIQEHREHWLLTLTKDFNFKPRWPAGYFKDGERLHLDGVTVDVIGTPGHTPGHLSFYFREAGVLFMGDYDLSGFGPWYGDVEASIEQTIISVGKLKGHSARVWITGHETGLFEQDPAEKWDQYLDVISHREDKLLAFLKHPRTIEEIVSAWLVYGKPREPKAFFEFGERALMKKHLEKLLGKAQIEMAENRYYTL
ncbi:MAG: beta-lactamase [Desulfatitalea sp. BRH_c12]|nr:MAG: beta-lactamase [Desulfatitalea sp. BRH_c12]